MSLFTTRRFVLAAPLALMLLAATLRPAAAEALEARPGDLALGRADAPITMVEYYSLNCPHCGAFHAQIFPTLKADYIDTGKVRFVFRDFPLSWGALQAAARPRSLQDAGRPDYGTLFRTEQPRRFAAVQCRNRLAPLLCLHARH